MKKLSIIVPCYNEQQTVEALVYKVANAKIPVAEKEIIVVDDCSTDGTWKILENIKNKGLGNVGFKLQKHQQNSGKGFAIRTGISLAEGDIIIIQDADMEYDPNEYSKIIEPIVTNKADVVYGTRFPKQLGFKNFSIHLFGNKMLTLMSNMFSGLKLTDMETCYKAFRSEIIKKIKLESNRFGFEPEVTAKISKLKIRIIEVPISYAGRKYSEGKKIGFKDAIDTAWCIIRYNVLD